MNRLLLSLLGLCAAVTIHAQDTAALPKALTPAPRAEPALVKRHESFNEISKKGEGDIVFLGDSITQGWDGGGKAIWDKTWAPLKAVNFGISGDRTEHVLWRLDHGNYDGLHPKLTVLMIGTNNTGHSMEPAAGTAAGVKAIIEKLHAKQPKMKILLLAIFPRGEKPDDKARLLNDQINNLIAPLASDPLVTWLDIGKTFLQPDGTLSKEIMPDFLHPNARGYQLWSAAIEPEVEKLLAE